MSALFLYFILAKLNYVTNFFFTKMLTKLTLIYFCHIVVTYRVFFLCCQVKCLACSSNGLTVIFVFEYVKSNKLVLTFSCIIACLVFVYI